MIRPLAVVALGGALLSVICITASGAMSRGSWHVPDMVWHVGDDDDTGDGPTLHLTGNEPQISRDLPWAGSDNLTFDVPASVSYTQGPAAKITLTGPDALVNAVELHDTTLRLTRHIYGMDSGHALHIAITGPAPHSFELDSAVKLDIANLATDELHVELDGAGKVTAQGTAKSIHLEIDGAGDADLGALTLTDAHVEINGIGHVVAGPTGDAHVEINGAGKVSLTKRPSHLSQEINGAGSISQPDAPAGQTL
jgi:hypothetical protein